MDHAVGKLARHDIVIGALQETKWFGCGAYKTSHSMVLTSGRRTPGEGGCGTSAQRAGSGTTDRSVGTLSSPRGPNILLH